MLLAQKETYAKAISFFAKHGLENAPEKLKKDECSAVLTLGFGIKVSGKIAEMKKQLQDEEIAKGRSDAAFWKILEEATSEEAGEREERGPNGDPRGQKRPREETDKREEPKRATLEREEP